MGKAFCSLQGKLGLGFPPARPVEKYKGSEAVLCSAPRSFPGPENTKRTPATEQTPETERAFPYLGPRGVWEAVGVAAAGAAREGVGTGRCVDSCQPPWSRTSAAHRASPAEMGAGAQERTVRPLEQKQARPPLHTQPGCNCGSCPPDPCGRKAGVGGFKGE